jgi:hypothetical protein
MLYAKTTFVHELFHVIDWSSGFNGGLTTQWSFPPISVYAAHPDRFLNPQRWDRWAEAGTVYTFGSEYQQRPDVQFLITDYSSQMSAMQRVLNKGRW